MKSEVSCSALLFSLSILLLAGCEKEIDMDYRTADALYVVEAHLSQLTTEVRVTTTQAITDNQANGHGVTDAIITLTAGDSIRRTLQHRTQGRYTTNFIGKPGTTYHLNIDVGGHHFTAASTMQSLPQMNSFRFVWKSAMGQRFLFGDLRLQDQTGQANYYFLHLYRNGVGYRWAVLNDRSNPGKELQQLFTCQREGTSDDDALREGDRLHLVIRAIDRAAYNYLYSMQNMGNNMSNPLSNFTGGCLGYFSAYSEITHDLIFHLSEVEEE